MFGGSGKTGSSIIKQALDKDYEVSALLRSPEKLVLRHEKLSIVEGDVLDPAVVPTVIKGSDAVLSALGVSGLGNTTLYSDSIRNVVRGMTEHGVKRILCIAAAGVEPGPDPNIPFLGRLIMNLFLKKVYADMYRMQQHLEDTDLEWTVMWPPMLTLGELTGSYRTALGKALCKGSKISRADLAHFMVHNIENPAYYKQKVAVAY